MKMRFLWLAFGLIAVSQVQILDAQDIEARPFPGQVRIAPIQRGPISPYDMPLPDIRPWMMKQNGKLDPNDLQNLLKQLQSTNDPEKLQQILKNNSTFNDPAFQNKLQEMMKDKNFKENLQKQLNQTGQPTPKIDDDIQNKFKDFLDQAKKNNQPPSPAPIGMPMPPNLGMNQPLPKENLPKTDFNPQPPGANPIAPDGALPGGLPKTKEHPLTEWAKRNFADSPEMQKAIKELAGDFNKDDLESLLGDNPEMKKLFDDIGNDSSLFDDSWFKNNDLGKQSGSWWGNSNGGGGSSWGNSGGGSSGGSGGSSGGGFEVSGSSAGTVFGIILGAVAAIFLTIVGLRLYKQKQEEARARGLLASQAGFDYSTIRTRDDVVEAYNRLSIDQHGPDAVTWNHRVVAEQWIDQQPKLEEPAAELAKLYEKARYAPLEEDLSQGEIQTARTDICTIAGVRPS